MTAAIVATIVCALGAAALMVAEQLGERRAIWVAKPIASAAFLATALFHHALSTAYGRGIAGALALSLLGDVLLIPHSRAIFRAGILAFLAGHLAFVAAFAQLHIDRTVGAAVLGADIVVAVVVSRWLLPHVERGLRGAVIAYVVVISAMVAAACATRVPLVAGGAIAFYLSDLSVARDRFVKPGFINRAWGLPLYYGAQLVLAWSVQ